jgi:hypothetical protein
VQLKLQHSLHHAIPEDTNVPMAFPAIHRPRVVTPPMRGFVKQCGEPADLEIVLEENHEIGILELE